MSAVDELVAAVEGSAKLDRATKEAVVGFLQEGGPALGVLAPELIEEVFRLVAGNSRAAAIETIAGSLSAGQVTALLRSLEQEMNQAADAKPASGAAAAALIAALEKAALVAITQAIIAAL